MTQNAMPPVRKLKVLIADDVQETRRSTRLMLSTIPYVEVVAIATNGSQAINMAIETHPDIVITDINMPEVNGLSVVKEVINLYPDTGCIIMSAEKDEVTRHAVKMVGVQEFLNKPFTVDELEAAIANTGKRIAAHRKKLADAERLRQSSEQYLSQMAEEYARTRRTDMLAMDVFEQLAVNPNCELRWLRTLAMIYIIRQEWGKLKLLAERLEKTK